MSIYRRVFQYYRPFLGQTIVGLVLSILAIGLNLLKPWPFKLIVDRIIPAFHAETPGTHFFRSNFAGSCCRRFSLGMAQ